MIRQVNSKIGMRRLVGSVIKSIDQSELAKQKNLLSAFIDE